MSHVYKLIQHHCVALMHTVLSLLLARSSHYQQVYDEVLKAPQQHQ